MAAEDALCSPILDRLCTVAAAEAADHRASALDTAVHGVLVQHVARDQGQSVAPGELARIPHEGPDEMPVVQGLREHL
jgi:hypothetical protein